MLDQELTPELYERVYAIAMKKLAKLEKRKGKTPRTNTGHFVPLPSRVRKEIMDYFSTFPEPATTNQLLNHVDAKAPNLRRVCRDMVKEGLMRSERTMEGCIYTFVGDPT